MSERSEYATGEFCWVDLSTPDVEAAKEFYADLLGWEAESAPGPVEETGGYGFFTRHGRQVAGFGPTFPEGAPPNWSSYVKVEDADEAVDKAKQAGGNVLFGPVDLPNDAGRMAVIADPAGAVISVLQMGATTGAQVVNEPGSWTWNQLGTRDIDGARDFYGKVFDWALDQSEQAPEEAPYWMWQVKGQRWPEGMAGAMRMGDDIPAEVPPHWMVYFAVDDTDDAVAKVKDHGGSVFVEPMDIGVGRLAAVTDPQGAVFSVIDLNYPEPR